MSLTPPRPDGSEPDAVPPRPRWVLPALGAGIVALVAASNIGNAVWASWVTERPLGLLALNGSNKYVILTSGEVGLWSAVAVASLRLLAPDPLFYALGYLYRDRALHWGRTAFPGSGALLDQFEADRSAFKNVLWVLAVVAPNNPVCLLAGVAAFPIPTFVVLNVIGTVGRVLLMRLIGWVFRDELAEFIDVVGRYQQWFTIGSIAIVVGYVLWQAVGRKGLIGGVEELEEELGEEP
jgi:membrane protein DedA with SNARE-associated domain